MRQTSRPAGFVGAADAYVLPKHPIAQWYPLFGKQHRAPQANNKCFD